MTRTNVQPIVAPPVLRPPTLTRKQLVDAMLALKGTPATFTTIITRTEPNMRKGGNPFVGNIFKISRVNGIINWHYVNSVNNQREREGKVADFVPQPRKWGQRIEGTPLVEHKGHHYIELKVERSLGHEYVYANGDSFSTEDLQRLQLFLVKSKQPETQQTDKEIILRDYDIGNIIAIVYGGTQYIVVPL